MTMHGTLKMRAHSWLPLLSCFGLICFGLVRPAQAVKVSATTNTTGPYTNSMALAPKITILDPGAPNFINLPSLAAPPLFGTNSDMISGFSFGTPLTAVQMMGDAISSMTQPSAGTYDINLTLTNFTFSSIALPSNEYVYLNVWETYTGLPFASTASWTGGPSITGTACRTSVNDALYIEPIVTVFDPGSSTWIAASNFFGGTPQCGAISASAPVLPLTAYISGGTLTVGFESILGLANVDLVAADTINLLLSLELNLRYMPNGAPPAAVPGPLPLAGCTVAWSWARRLRRKGHSS